MKISNELKVGALTAIAIVILILGFNYLKGTALTDRSDKLYAVFPSVKGLALANPVYVNGLNIGKIGNLKETDKDLSGILVQINLHKDVNIPKNSVAAINTGLMGSGSLEIVLGNSNNMAKDGDTLQILENVGVMEKLNTQLTPTINNVNKTLLALEELIQKTSGIVDESTQRNLRNIVSNLEQSTAAINHMTHAQNGIIAKTFSNLEGITGNLEANNEQITNTLGNLENATAQLADADIKELISSVESTMNKLDETIAQVNSKEGTLGLLLNDTRLYEEIRQTNRSLTTLLDDLRTNPKRYVNISVFGRKDKSGPLPSPIYDSVTIE